MPELPDILPIPEFPIDSKAWSARVYEGARKHNDKALACSVEVCGLVNCQDYLAKDQLLLSIPN